MTDYHTKTRTDRLRIDVADGFDPNNPDHCRTLCQAMTDHRGGQGWQADPHSYRGGAGGVSIETLNGQLRRTHHHGGVPSIEIFREVTYTVTGPHLNRWATETYDRLAAESAIKPLVIASVYHGMADLTLCRWWMAHCCEEAGDDISAEHPDADALGAILRGRAGSSMPESLISRSRERIKTAQDVRQGSVMLNRFREKHELTRGPISRVPGVEVAEAVALLPEPKLLIHAAQAEQDRSPDSAYDTVFRRDSADWWASGLSRTFHLLADMLEDRRDHV